MTFWQQLAQWFKEFWSGFTLPAREIAEPIKEAILPKPKPTVPAEAKDLPWMRIAKSQLGVKEIPGAKKNPVIAEYHKAAAFNGTEDDSWCSSFLCWTFEKAGLTSPNSPQARSWLKWGYPMDKPEYGCVVVLWREDPASWKGHCGLYHGETKTGVLLLGGNQNNQVCILEYPKARVLGYRWPKNFQSNDLKSKISSNVLMPY